ncbi:glutaconyl-CoA decarboxylase subunit beta [Malaciobacter halophilus]|uniref:Glutaconyl-CoA decarboxylase subunit beta n=1 Tax=Malaciobacter halophilus TaxID=197482 RepID=A0A2N1J2L2_9BACT|nr:sodium ion-translocating decarboxylase subunit beta [Malaciobacter halophilus]AXH09741.1 oxaloacetate decarboxylase, beta subunit [Malaciobacter halophilus]PKI80712.1 glutaconyl-CoA decarboxylase subunit beta [Malaciobacter halophilus]
MKKNLIISIFVFLMSICSVNAFAAAPAHDNTAQVEKTEYESRTLTELIKSFYHTTGLNAIVNPKEGVKDSHGQDMTIFAQSFGRVIMIIICFILFYLAIKKGFEPLLLIPIGFGGILANIPIANIAGDHGMLGIIYNMGIANEFFPLLIFMGVGAMTDFGPLLANPKTALLGGAAQFGIFGSLVGAVVLSQYIPGIEFSLQQAAAISIIGGADGPTSIFIASALAPELLGAIAVAAYSYMALVPVIQPPIMRALTNDAERKIKMTSMRKVSKLEKIVFPIVVLVLTLLILPDASPLIGALCFGNFAKESGVVERLSDTMQNALINIVTIFLGLGVGSKLAAEQFLVAETMGIMVIGLVAFAAGTAAGLIMAKTMNKFSSKENQINPLIGAAGVSAVPMAARVVSKEGQKYDPSNVMLMHAMGPNVAGVIGSAVAAGVLLSIFK